MSYSDNLQTSLDHAKTVGINNIIITGDLNADFTTAPGQKANQSGFMPGDSTVNQLLSLYHELCVAIDEEKEVRIVFLDISKAFEKFGIQDFCTSREKRCLR